MQMKYAMYIGLAALSAVGLMSDAAPTATGMRGADVFLAAEEVSKSSAESLDAWIDSLRRQHNIPAMGAIVFRADTVLARGIAGVRRSNSMEPVEERDRFQLGSNTKAITATVLATFVEEGKLAWTTTLADVFPEWRDSISADFRAVTLDLLLSHHAGISPFEDTDARDFRSIPRLSGTPMQQRAAFVFKPLGLTGAFAWSDSPDANQLSGHYETRGGARPVDPRDPAERVPPIIWPAGSVELSLEDYAHFLQVNLRGLQGRDTPLLKATTIKHLHTSPVSPPDSYGLGWGLQDFDGAPASVHVGSAGTFYAITIIQPTRDLGVAVFANAGGERATAAATEAVKALIRRFAKVAGK